VEIWFAKIERDVVACGEAMNASGDEWGEDRMIAEAQAHADLNAEELPQRLFRAADAFAAGAPQHDDMTIVVLRL